MSMHYLYILYSEKLERYYIGETHNVELRLEQHNSGYYENQWTKRGQPWELHFTLECSTKTQALKIEKHIKKMKSKKYVLNFIKYKAIRDRLLKMYANS